MSSILAAGAGKVALSQFIRSIEGSALAPWAGYAPWQVTSQSPAVVRQLLVGLPPDKYRIEGEVAVHKQACVEPGATLKGPLVISAGCFVATGAYLRGGCWLGPGCSLGSGVELKSSFVFSNSRLAHFNFVGDSWVGADVNLEAGSIVCNHRNERDDKEVRVQVGGQLFLTGVEKFGAVIADHCRIGANAVLAPGSLLSLGAIVRRGEVVEQDPTEPVFGGSASP